MKVWDCSLQCYDARFISSGGSAVEDHYVWLSFLPFEDKGANAELDNFLKYDKKPDGFGAQAWVAGQIFATAVNSDRREERPERHHPRSDARPRSRACTTSTPTASSHRPTSAARPASKCLVGMQVQNGKFVRVDPVEPGKFDCTGGTFDVHARPGEGVQRMSDPS